MTAVRVYELARDLGVSSRRLLAVLEGLGADTKNHMSLVDPELVDKVKAALASPARADPGARAPQPRPIKAATPPPRPLRAAPPAPRAAPPAAQRPRPAQPPARPADRPAATAAPAPERVQRPVAPARPARPQSSPADRPAPKPAPPAARPGGQQTAQRAPLAAPRPDRPATRPPAPGPRPAPRPPAPGTRPVKPGQGPPRRPLPPERGPAGARPAQQRRPETRPGRPAARREPDRAARPRPAAPRTVVIEPGSLTVQEFARKLGISGVEAIKALMRMGVMASLGQRIDAETARIVAAELGHTVVEPEPVRPPTELPEEPEDRPEELVSRPPVVTVMGHVDHGKTSLLDAIRETHVTEREAGGITQHIGASTVEWKQKRIVFLDTPGHEAFTAMRARGARVTDIVVLVVAADDGVMPQTVEAINHVKAAEVPMVVAINKCDKPDADPERVKRGLTEHNLVPEEWGGDTVCVNVSAKSRQGLDQLLEMILLVAELQDLKANPNRPARGVVIEAQLDRGRGPVATALVQTGTLRVGDTVVCGATWGRVRAMMDDRGRRVDKASPSTPVEIVGLNDVPEAGDAFQVVADEKLARSVAEARQAERRQAGLGGPARRTFEDLMRDADEDKVKELRLVLKADVQGSVEALKQALAGLGAGKDRQPIRLTVIHEGVGAVTETDVMLAAASEALVIGFNVRPDANARRVADQEGVEIRTYRVIYDVVNDVGGLLAGLVEPEYREVVTGRAEVRATFRVPRAGTVAGCYVQEGKITRNSRLRLIRDGTVVWEGKVGSLRRFKEDVREVAAGLECGIGLEGFNDIKEGDVLEAFAMEEVKA